HVLTIEQMLLDGPEATPALRAKAKDQYARHWEAVFGELFAFHNIDPYEKPEWKPWFRLAARLASNHLPAASKFGFPYPGGRPGLDPDMQARVKNAIRDRPKGTTQLAALMPLTSPQLPRKAREDEAKKLRRWWNRTGRKK